jgi:hypothetical protein
VVLEGLIVFPPFEPGLDFLGQGEGLVDLVGGEIGDMQKIAFHGSSS